MPRRNRLVYMRFLVSLIASELVHARPARYRSGGFVFAETDAGMAEEIA